MSKRRRKRQQKKNEPTEPFDLIFGVLYSNFPDVPLSNWDVTVYKSDVSVESILFDLSYVSRSCMVAVGIEKGIPDIELEKINRALDNQSLLRKQRVVLLRNLPVGTHEKLRLESHSSADVSLHTNTDT